MLWNRTAAGIAKFVIIIAGLSSAAVSQNLPVCSWPLETTGTGVTNVAYPDTNATYWTMPIDTARWKTVTITGTYPQSRFFSFVTYVAQGTPVPNGALNDTGIDPDPNNSNPFRPDPVEGQPQQYTITASQTAPVNGGTNFLPLASTRLSWLIYRIYVPNKGLGRNAGVPLPTLTLVDQSGNSRTLSPCRPQSGAGGVASLIAALGSQGLNEGIGFLRQLIAPDNPLVGQTASCQPLPLVAWIPEHTGGYFPNPANKYIAIPGLCFQPDRILVVRGKRAIFPYTFNGSPIWVPSGTQLRYWSLCNNNQRVPYPVVGCEADHSTKVDRNGYYTYVVSEPERYSKGAPSWVPRDATWLPWGSRRAPNILLLRNMLPADDFPYSVQAAIAANCSVDNSNGAPSRDEIVRGGNCAHMVMKQYYPQAVYCNKQLFINEGWQGCFAAAKASGHLFTGH
jgi:hypothetical protein